MALDLLWLLFAGAMTLSGDVSSANQRPAEIQQLVQQLADADFSTREQAQRRLLEIGAPAKEPLRHATKSADVEQRLRAEQILKEFRRAELWKPSAIRLKLEDASVLDVFRAIADQSGNPINWLRTPKSLNRRVAVAWDAMPYWKAVDEASRKGEVVPHWYDDPKRAGAIITHGTPGDYPTAHEGPLRLQLLTTRRLVSQSLNHGDGLVDQQDSLEMTFALQWEQRFALCRYGSKLRIRAARTDAGEDLRMDSRARFGLMHILRRHRQLVLPVSLRPPTKPAKTLTKLLAELELVAAGDFTTLAVKPSGGAHWDQQAGYTLELLGKKETGNLTEVNFRWTRPYPLDAVNATDLVDEYFRVLDGAGEELAFNLHQVLGDKHGVRYVLHVSGKPAAIEGHVALLRGHRLVSFEFNNIPMPGAVP